MPTDNPKISSYVPQKIYDRFKEYQKEQNITMSQAMIVILAEYFGIEETLKEINSSSPIGGVTFSAFQELQKRLEKVELKVEHLEYTQNLPFSNNRIRTRNRTEIYPPEEINDRENKQVQQVEDSFSLLSELPQNEILLSGQDLAKRLKISTSKLSTLKGKFTMEEFKNWSLELDPDGIEWTYKAKEKGRGVLYIASKSTQ